MNGCTRRAVVAAGLLLALLLASGRPRAPFECARAWADGSTRLHPSALVYRGAFRLPDGSGGSSWEYSGGALTYRATGDGKGPKDGYPGSLFGVGHAHQQHVSEISIPRPAKPAGGSAATLPVAQTLQPFHDVTAGRFGALEIPRAGLAWLPDDRGTGGGLLHHCWGQHFQFERQPSHGWSSGLLSDPRPAGPWVMGAFTNYVTNDYLFEIPDTWARAHVGGSPLATGRFRDGIWGGLGPALLAYTPPPAAQPLPAGGVIEGARVLLLYGSPNADSPEITVDPDRRMRSFSEADDWSGAAWLTAGDAAAVVFAGTKATGRTWYGFSNGVVYPTSGDPGEKVPEVPPWPHADRGWWSEGIQAQLIFFDPADLAAVAAGRLESWKPQPYATLDLDPFLLDPGFDHERSKRYLLGAIAFDRARGHLFVMECRADEDKSIVHVFRVRGG